MAKNNDKDIEYSKEAFDSFNSSIRESIDLTRQLTKNIKDLPSGLGLKKARTDKLIRGVQEYKASLMDIQKISERVAKGHANSKVITDHIVSLEAKYQKYIKENSRLFSQKGHFMKKQLALYEEINNKQEDIAQSDVNIDRYREKIAKYHEKERSGVGLSYKNEIEVLNEKIKEELNSIKIKEKGIEKALKEKRIIEETIENHKDIVKHYKKEIEGAQDLYEELKKNSIAGKIRSKDFSKVVEALKEIPELLAPLAGAFELVKGFAFEISEQVTGIRKGLIMTTDEATESRQEFNNMSLASNSLAVNTSRLVEANAALGKELGFNSMFTQDLNVQFVKLTKQIGLSEESAGGLAKISKATGMRLEDVKNITLETSQALSSRYGIQLDEKEVLEEIGKISGQTLAMLKANPKALAEAVAQSRLLGISLDAIRKQASSLLDFESSIENELQAELITGRQLNLERARAASLNGDLITAMKELNNQNLSFGEFSQMNVIAQDKIASALGLSSDELADQLLKQQYIGKSREEVAALAGKEVADRLEAISAQDKFNLAVDKMKDIVSSVVGGSLGRLVEMLASAAENSWVLYGAISAMAGISLTKLVVGLAASAVQAGILASGAITTASALTLGIGTAAVVAGILAIAAASNRYKKELTEPMAEGGLLYGPTNILAGEYTGAENNPEVIAPLSDLQNIIDKNRIIINNTESSDTSKMIHTLNETMKGVKEGIDKLNKRTGIVNIDGQKAGTAQLMGNYNLA